ncbi:MAG: hypothetical protein IE916_00645 [Epsilonproteobacteria bacterium]|nr:hypothetical protein [Campylobacterota bacterium]
MSNSNDTTILRENLFTFMFAPYFGMVKPIKGYQVEIDKNKKRKLVSIYSEEKFYPLFPVDNPLKHTNKYLFVLQALFLPIVFCLTTIFLGYRMTFHFNEVALWIGQGLFVVIAADMIVVLSKFHKYKVGLSDIIKHDKLKMVLLVLLFLAGAVMTQVAYIGFIELTSYFMMIVGYGSFIEYIKKQMFVLASENISYWEYPLIVDAATGRTESYYVAVPSIEN